MIWTDNKRNRLSVSDTGYMLTWDYAHGEAYYNLWGDLKQVKHIDSGWNRERLEQIAEAKCA